MVDGGFILSDIRPDVTFLHLLVKEIVCHQDGNAYILAVSLALVIVVNSHNGTADVLKLVHRENEFNETLLVELTDLSADFNDQCLLLRNGEVLYLLCDFHRMSNKMFVNVNKSSCNSLSICPRG